MQNAECGMGNGGPAGPRRIPGWAGRWTALVACGLLLATASRAAGAGAAAPAERPPDVFEKFGVVEFAEGNVTKVGTAEFPVIDC